jgi:hypothetical protein
VKKLLRNGRVFRDEFELGPLSRWRERERVRVVRARHYTVSNLAPLTLSLSPHEARGERGTIKDWLHCSSGQPRAAPTHVTLALAGPGLFSVAAAAAAPILAFARCMHAKQNPRDVVGNCRTKGLRQSNLSGDDAQQFINGATSPSLSNIRDGPRSANVGRCRSDLRGRRIIRNHLLALAPTIR